jgi:hypothetical protein
MWNEPDKEQLSKIPKLYETENVPLKDKLIHLHFFIGGCDWYVAEYDGEDLFWGYAILNNDFEMAEWGYVSFQELKDLKISPSFEVDCEKDWEVKKAFKIEKIRLGNHWPETKESKNNFSGGER